MSKGSVILVHKEARVLVAAMSLLAKEGFEVTGARDEVDALKKLESGFADLVVVNFPDVVDAVLVLYKPKGVVNPIGLICPCLPEVFSFEKSVESMNKARARVLALKENLAAQGIDVAAELALGLSQERDLTKLAQELLPKIAQVAMVEHMYLAVGFSPEKLKVIHTWDNSGVTWPVPLGLVELAGRQRTPLVITEGASPLLEVQEELKQTEIASALLIPLLAGGNLVGVLGLVNLTRGKKLTPKECQLPLVVAPALALAIENDRLKTALDEQRQSAQGLGTNVEHRQREVSALNNFVQSLNVRLQSQKETLEGRQEQYLASLRFVISALEADEPTLKGHAQEVVKWTLNLGEALGINLEGLAEAAYLHDVGRLPRARSMVQDISPSEGPAPAPEEYPVVSEKIAEIMKLPPPVRQAIRHQRENYDGTGYPGSLKGDDIPLASRLLRVSCTYMEMTSEAPGHKPFKTGEVLAHFRESSGRIYDPRVVETFLKLIKTESEKMDTGVVSAVSHELRSPLTYLMGYSEFLSASENLPAEARHAAQEIQTEAAHMASIIADFTDISRFELGKASLSFQEVDLAKLIERSVIKARTRTEKHQVEMELTANLPLVKADPDRIMQVLDNLLNNAINYSPQGGKIDVKAAIKNIQQVVISVSDQGIGIPRDKLSSLFQKYYRVDSPLKEKVKGMGIGLNLCKHIVEAHAGQIWVESQEGRGSTFYFTIPLQ